MAKIRTGNALTELISDLTSLDVDMMTDEMIRAAEPVMVESLTRHARKHKYSGSMIKSIKSTGIKRNKNGKYLVVRPTGKDKDGVRNMEKMAYLEYGTIKQKATPVLTPAVREAEHQIESKMNEIFNKYTEKVTT